MAGLGLHFEGGVTGGDAAFECVTQGNEASRDLSLRNRQDGGAINGES